MLLFQLFIVIMSGYAGNSDLEAEHAMILAENGIAAAQSMLEGRVLTHCLDCDEPIAEARRQVAIKSNHKCDRCITCQQKFELRPQPKIRMLDRIL